MIVGSEGGRAEVRKPGRIVSVGVGCMAALATLASTASSAQRALAPGPPPPKVTAIGSQITAQIDETMVWDSYPDSPGPDGWARLLWGSTAIARDGNLVVGIEGEGTFSAKIDATVKYTPSPTPPFCHNWHFTYAGAGKAVGYGGPADDLRFRFDLTDPGQPGRGLKGWRIDLPLTSWKGGGNVDKGPSAECGDYGQEMGMWFNEGRGFGGGTLGTGYDPMPRPAIRWTNTNGVVGAVISGKIVRGPRGLVKRQVASYTITCATISYCFGQPGSSDLDIGWDFKGARCERSPGGLVRLRVRVLMRVNNASSSGNPLKATWADSMSISARTGTGTSGLELWSVWTTQSRGGLLPDNSYEQVFEVLTEPFSPNADQHVLHLKYRWGIVSGKDIVQETTSPPLPAAATSCAG